MFSNRFRQSTRQVHRAVEEVRDLLLPPESGCATRGHHQRAKPPAIGADMCSQRSSVGMVRDLDEASTLAARSRLGK